MRRKRANIDSLNLSSPYLEAIFIRNEDYSVQTVKNKSNFEPEVWREAFGESLKMNITDARIVHSYTGLKLPLKTFSATPKSQTLEFAGLHGYNERSKLMLQMIRELESKFHHCRVTRLDIAIDFEGGIPQSITKALSRLRKPFRYGHTIYWKTLKEKKKNPYMDIVIYDKALHADLGNDLMRLEFRFKSGFLGNVAFEDIEDLFPKIEKTVKRLTGLGIEITSIIH